MVGKGKSYALEGHFTFPVGLKHPLKSREPVPRALEEHLKQLLGLN